MKYGTTSTRDLVTNWPYSFQRITEEDPLYEYLGVYATEIARLDAFLDTLYEQRFIESANSEELDKLAAALNVSRQADETDEQFRYRIQLRQIQAASNGTAADIRNLLLRAFGEQARQIEITTDPAAPVLRFTLPEQLLTEVPIAQDTFRTILEDAMPCGTSVTLITEDVFTFVAPEDEPPEYAAGFGEGTWTT